MSWSPLARSLWIPETTSRAFVLTYVTVDAFGKRARSTGTVFVPRGRAPKGGWPVISWAHGTSGLHDSCAPSRTGPALPERDWKYLASWMRQGYAVVASDYAGLGTRGLPAYLDGKTTAYNVVDMVLAAREFSGRHFPRSARLARKWVTIGQSQGAGAAVYTARHATEFGGSRLDYRGAVGTGTPAYIENYLLPLGPKVPPIALPPGLTAYLTYIFTSLRHVHPELGIDEILTPTGREYLSLAEKECVFTFEKHLKNVNVGDYFTSPPSALPGFRKTVRAYMGMPESGFDKPFFMAHGLKDTDVPIPATLAYVGVLRSNRQPLTFKTYATDHSGTLSASLKHTVPFVKRLFRGGS
ncbi:alpha/beta hydrolase family protein [Actinocorallia populi]|uniref:alpha/beta hydrolase family protein n=1 Tax=Actinocorallia populi TaxID=2079200 RepID=UPI000D094031|nr:lipase family protein [Actinocorallia populi]